jgi:predicted RNase H-like nuclease
MQVLGIDGCRGGWIGIWHSPKQLKWFFSAALEDLIASPPPSHAFIDMPIGLSNTGPRLCDRAARQMLGRKFSSSVFPTPCRLALKGKDYPEANGLNRQQVGSGLSKQSYYLLPKIREVDNWLRNPLNSASLLREAHPEVAFHAIKGASLCFKKKTPEGFQERLDLLCQLDGRVAALTQNILAATRRKDIAADDILDACCLAVMPLSGRLQTLPAKPERDNKGLNMEICYYSTRAFKSAGPVA